MAIDSRILWPVRVVYTIGGGFEAEAPINIEMNLEDWNCPDDPYIDGVILRDRSGNLLRGRMCLLDLKELHLDERPSSLLSRERLEELLDSIADENSSVEDRMNAAVEFQIADDDAAVEFVTKRFGPGDSPFTLLLAISLLAGRNTHGHVNWLMSLLSSTDKAVREATNWAFTVTP